MILLTTVGVAIPLLLFTVRPALFFASPFILLGGVMLVFVGAWAFEQFLFDIGKTAVYLTSEAPTDALTGFDTSKLDTDHDATDRKEVFRSSVPNAVITRLENWAGNGEFQHRL